MSHIDDYDDLDDRAERDLVSFPRIITTAGIIWIAYGFMAICVYIISFAVKAIGMWGPGAGPTVNFGGSTLGLIVAIVFLVVGYQSMRGTAKSTLGSGVGSVALGLVNSVVLVFFLIRGIQAPGGQVLLFLVAGVTAIKSLCLLTAGLLAIAGHKAYAKWKTAHWYDSSRHPSTAEEDDYEDRPRLRRDLDDR